MTVPTREESQARLDKLSAGVLGHTPTQTYTLGDRLEERATQFAERPFLYFEDRVLTYRQLNEEANRVAHAALAAGLGTGDVAALAMENRPEFLTTWMGLAKLGVTIALLNTNVKGQPLRHSLQSTKARLLVVGGECVGQLESLGSDLGGVEKVWVANEAADPTDPTDPTDCSNGREQPVAIVLAPLLAQMPTTNPDKAVRARLVAGDDLFFMFTSGTTGLPKAARLSHMRYMGVGDGMSSISGYEADDVIACVLPLFHGAGGMVVISSALSKGAAVMLRRKFSASKFWDDARRYGVTGFQYVGEICRYLVNQPPSPDDRKHKVRTMMGAGLGASVWREFRERFGVKDILEGWSSTEANTSLTNLDNRVGSCGRMPFKERHNGRLIRYDVENDCHVRGPDGFCIECGPNEVGEFIGMILSLPNSGAGRFEGYSSPEETKKKVLHDVFQKGDAWYRSGDLLYRDEEDYFYFVDRMGDTFRWKSENVSTQEVADVLGQFPGLEIANVYGVKIPNTEGRAGMAALVLRDPDRFDGRAFFELTQQRLPSYAAPMFVRLVKDADVTSTFKLRKVDLQKQGYDPALVSDPLYFRDESASAYVPLTAAHLARLG